MKFLSPLGRVLSALKLFLALPYHLAHGAVHAAAGQRVVLPTLLVPLSGVLVFFAGLGVALGNKARRRACALVVFLVPITLCMHAFWRLSGPQTTFVEEVVFLKDIPMLGGALLILQFGSGLMADL